MNGFAFRTGMAFELAGAAHRIERLGADDQVVLERLHDGYITVSTRDDLLSAYCDGKIAATKIHGADRLPEKQYGRPIHELPDHVRNELKRRMAYLQAMEDRIGTFVFMADSLEPLIEEVAGRIGDTKPPSVITLYRWYSRYRHHQKLRSLIPRYDLRGRSGPAQQARCLELAEDATREAFQASPAASIRNIYDRLVGKIRAENQRQLQGNQIAIPSLRTMYRLFGRMEAYDVAVLRNGKASADRRFRIVKGGPKVSRILERVEVDHTPLDLFLIDEKTRLPLGRPTLTVFIDVFSRFPLGYYLSFGGTSAAVVIGGLRHAILPKRAAVETIPNLQVNHVWPCYGLIESMVLDNGLEFHGDDLESIAFDLGIHLQYCPKRQPRFKGVIERYLKTVNYFFAHQLPGTSLAKLADRGDYDPTRHAVLTLAEFQHVFEKWLLDIYSQSVHRGIGTTPWAKWHEGLSLRTPELPSSIADLQRRIGLVKERTLSHQGIALHGLHYAGPELIPVIRAWGPGVKLRVVFDPDDLGSIQVWPPEQQEPVTVQAVHFDYANQLTLFQHKLIRELARENGRSAEDADALAEAKYQLTQAIDNLLNSRKQRARRQAANMHGMSSRNPNARLEFPKPKPANPIPKPVQRLGKDRASPAAPPAPFPSFTLMPNKKGEE